MGGCAWRNAAAAAIALGAVLGAATARGGEGGARANSEGIKPGDSTMAGVRDPYVTTDTSVDCRTVESILKGLIKDDMTDEEKVLAVFNWIRRLLYHGDGPVKYAYNFHHMLHTYGHGSCLRQTTPMWVLLDRLGYKCRNVAVRGHHCIEVEYGGKWHLFDPHTTFYVYDRGTPRTIASVEQIKADPTIARDAVKEGRACPGFLLCGDGIGTFATTERWRVLGDFPEARRYTPVIEEPFGGITLRRGESYVRTWMPGTHWFRANWPRKDVGPRHLCGRRDRKDTVNWPVYEPHVAARTYRHAGAGYLIYQPDLAADYCLNDLAERDNVTAKRRDGMPALVPEKAGKPGQAVFRVNCPYVVTAGELTLTHLGKGEPAAAVSTDEGESWTPIDLEGDTAEMKAAFVDQVNGSHKGYLLRLNIPADAGVAEVRLKTEFQLNPYALPYLVPGKNTVTVEAAAYGAPLTVTWKWSEGENWKTPRSVTKTFSADGSFEIECAGPKYPRMESLTLADAP